MFLLQETLFQRFGHVRVKYFKDFILVIYSCYILNLKIVFNMAFNGKYESLCSSAYDVLKYLTETVTPKTFSRTI